MHGRFIDVILVKQLINVNDPMDCCVVHELTDQFSLDCRCVDTYFRKQCLQIAPLERSTSLVVLEHVADVPLSHL